MSARAVPPGSSFSTVDLAGSLGLISLDLVLMGGKAPSYPHISRRVPHSFLAVHCLGRVSFPPRNDSIGSMDTAASWGRVHHLSPTQNIMAQRRRHMNPVAHCRALVQQACWRRNPPFEIRSDYNSSWVVQAHAAIVEPNAPASCRQRIRAVEPRDIH